MSNKDWLEPILIKVQMQKTQDNLGGTTGQVRKEAETAILSKLESIEQEARGCVDCKKIRCENCERLWQT